MATALDTFFVPSRGQGIQQEVIEQRRADTCVEARRNDSVFCLQAAEKLKTRLSDRKPENGLLAQISSEGDAFSTKFFDRNSLLSSINVCGKQKDLLKGSCLHAVVIERGSLKRDIALVNALLRMYAKCGAIKKANDLFNQLPRRNIVTWNALIAGFVEHGLCQEALTCLEHMYSEGLSPNAITFISILKACGTLGASEKGKEIHGELDKQGLLEKDIALDNALVDMYAKCGQMNKAFTVLEKLPRRDVVTWNSLIAGYTNHGLYDEALTSFKKMQDDGISPDTITFICLLKACSSIRAADKGEELCAEIDRQGLLGKNMVLGTALIDMYANCGMVAKAQGIFDIFAARDVAMWTALISGYANQGRDDDALNCFERMQEDGFSPDALTFSCILKACGSLGAITKGSQIHEEIQRQGLLAGDAMLGTALVGMYVKSGNLTKAQKVFDDFPMRPVSLWTVLIAGYAEFGHVETVFALFMKMRREGLEPDVILFVVLLTACSHSGLLEEAQLWFQNMSCIFGIAPTVEHYACIIDAFSRAGHFHKALSIISRVSDSHGLKLCSTLLGSCREQSSVELGLWAFGNAVYHDKSCAGTYVSMSNIHAVC